MNCLDGQCAVASGYSLSDGPRAVGGEITPSRVPAVSFCSSVLTASRLCRRFSQRCWTAAVVAAVLCVPTMASAEEPPVGARLIVGQAGADALKADLKAIVESSPNVGLRKQWSKVAETLDSFLVGISPSKPLRLDLIVGSEGFQYQPFLPALAIAGNDGLLSNLTGFGFQVKELGSKSGVYELKEQGKKPFYMRAKANSYIQIAASQADLPASVPDVEPVVKELLQGKFDVVAQLKNTADGMEARRKEYQALRGQLEAAIKFKRNESKAEFELRKLAAVQNFEEMERFVVESEHLEGGWTTDEASLTGTGSLILSGLEGTTIAKEISEMGVKPSRFGRIVFHEGPVIAARANAAISAHRIESIANFLSALEPVTRAKLEKLTQLSQAERDAALTAGGEISGLINRTAQLGIFDGFIDAHASEGGKYTMVGALRVENGAPIEKVVGMLPTIRQDWKVKLNTLEHGGIKVHEIEVPERRQKEFQTVFAGTPVIYIGTGADTIWMAAGNGAIDELKAAIDQAGTGTSDATEAEKPAAPVDQTVLAYTVKLGPLIELAQEMFKTADRENPPKSKEEQRAAKDRDTSLGLFHEGLKGGKDLVQGSLVRSGSQVLGTITVESDVLRAIGSLIGDFAKKNL